MAGRSCFLHPHQKVKLDASCAAEYRSQCESYREGDKFFPHPHPPHPHPPPPPASPAAAARFLRPAKRIFTRASALNSNELWRASETRERQRERKRENHFFPAFCSRSNSGSKTAPFPFFVRWFSNPAPTIRLRTIAHCAKKCCFMDFNRVVG